MGRAAGPRASVLKSSAPSAGGNAGTANSASCGESGAVRGVASCGAP